MRGASTWEALIKYKKVRQPVTRSQPAWNQLRTCSGIVGETTRLHRFIKRFNERTRLVLARSARPLRSALYRPAPSAARERERDWLTDVQSGLPPEDTDATTGVNHPDRAGLRVRNDMDPKRYGYSQRFRDDRHHACRLSCSRASRVRDSGGGSSARSSPFKTPAVSRRKVLFWLRPPLDRVQHRH